MDNGLLQAIRDIIKEEINPIKENLDKLNDRIEIIEKDVKDIKSLVIELDPQNANRHLEITGDLKELKTDVRTIKEELKKVEVVTGKNCIEIEYLKAVK